MSSVFGWIMFACTSTVLLFNLLYMYPRNWKERKIILGVKNRKEFKEADAALKVEEIVGKAHKQAMIITGVCFVTAVSLLFLRGMIMQTFFWILLIFAVIIVSMIPYIYGHSALMSLKNDLGINKSPSTNLADIKVSGKVHALKPISVVIPNVCGFIPVIVSLLLDLKLISFGNNRIAGSFISTVIISTFWSMGLFITLFAYIFDNMKNEVISPDSDVNANYNRAKKKNRADLCVRFIWGNVIYTVITAAGLFFKYSDLLMIQGLLVYMLLLFTAVFVFIHFDKKIEARYSKETELLLDDDECWIAGMFYYNPKDKRMNVEKRAGVGTTVNFAHPGGKIVGAVGIGGILTALLSLVWVGLLESTPISLRTEDSKVICHQIRDDYVIPFDDIESVEYGDNIMDHTVIRISGVGMETLLKGNFSVDGVNGCKLFLNPQTKEYIRITTKEGRIYYVGGVDAKETEAVMSALESTEHIL